MTKLTDYKFHPNPDWLNIYKPSWNPRLHLLYLLTWLEKVFTVDHAVIESSQHVDRWSLLTCHLLSCPLTFATWLCSSHRAQTLTRHSRHTSSAGATVNKLELTKSGWRLPGQSRRGLMKVTDVTLDVVQAQDCSLVVVVVVVFVLLIGAVAQLVLYHLGGVKDTLNTLNKGKRRSLKS